MHTNHNACVKIKPRIFLFSGVKIERKLYHRDVVFTIQGN